MDQEKGLLLGAILVVGIVSILLVLSYLQYVLLAILLGYLLHPVQRRLAPRVGGVISALGLIALAVLAIVLPLALVLNAIVGELSALREVVTDEDIDVSLLQEIFESDLGGGIQGLGEQQFVELVGRVVGVLGDLANVAIGLTVLFFLLYYFLIDGEEFVAWVRMVTPLPRDIQDELVRELDRLMWAVIVANVVVAVVQGVLTGIGLAIVGFSNVVFWTAVTTLLGLLPLIGASVVWIPIAGYLLLTGQVFAGVFLAVYGATVIGLSDNYLRPVVSGRESHVSPAVFVVGIFGGLAVIGVMGVFFGPIVLASLRVLIEIYTREYGSIRGGPSGS